MTIAEVYEQYKIMPFLQLHQLRVAAVGKLLADNFNGSLDARSVVLACLLHDMGNIIKFDLDIFPDSTADRGLAYWQEVKEDFIRRFGRDEHHATIAIAHELHVPLQVMRYIEGVGFSKLDRTVRDPSYEQKIVEYADCRVAPYGVASVEERLEDGRTRYAGRKGGADADERFNGFKAAAFEVEKQIFEREKIRPDDISEGAVQPAVAELRHFSL